MGEKTGLGKKSSTRLMLTSFVAAVAILSIAAAMFLHGPGKTSPSVTTVQGSQSAANQTVAILLSQTHLAPYAYQIYPYNSSTPRTAYSGFNITTGEIVNGNVTVRIANYLNQSQNVSYSFLSTDRLYYIDTSFGDDSAPSGEYSLGDDGAVLTNSTGYIVKG